MYIMYIHMYNIPSPIPLPIPIEYTVYSPQYTVYVYISIPLAAQAFITCFYDDLRSGRMCWLTLYIDIVISL